jgi:hypothetical protein
MLRAQQQLTNAKKPTLAQVVTERLGALRVAFQRHIADDAAQLRRVAERLVAAREDAFEAHLDARSRERARRRAALRRLRVAYARRALPRLHALRREAFALARLGERMRADAARIAGEAPGGRGYRFDVEPGGDLQAQYDHQEYRLNDDDMPGFADLLRAADAHTLGAERLVARARAAFKEDASDARVLVRPPLLRVAASELKEDAGADIEEALERLPPLPCESEISDDDESDMSGDDGAEEPEDKDAEPASDDEDATEDA